VPTETVRERAKPPASHHIDKRARDLIEAANEGTDDDLLNTPRTAVWLGVSPEWLEIGRSKGYGPPFLRLAPRRVRYHRGTVKLWLLERSHASTAEYETTGGRPRKGASDAAAD
jgi:hypothetical protein